MRRWAIMGIVAVAVLGGAQSAAAAPGWLAGTQAFGDTQSEYGAGTMAADGTVAVARVHASGSLEVRLRPPGGALGPALPLAPFAGNPVLAAGPAGHIALLWRENGAEHVAVRPPGGAFGAAREITVESNPAPDQVAVDGSGRVWIARPDLANVSVSTVGPDGVGRSFPLGEEGDWISTWASIGVDAAGRITAVYQRTRASLGAADGDPCQIFFEIRVAEGDANGLADVAMLEQGTTTGIMESGGCGQTSGTEVHSPAVAVRANGQALATYALNARSGGSEVQTQVVARIRPASGGWPANGSPAEPIDAGRFGPSGIPAFAGARPVVVLYHGLAGEIQLSARANDGSWSTPQLVAPNGGDRPHVASSPSGSLAIGYVEGGFGRPARIMGVVRGPGGALSSAVPLSGDADDLTTPVGVGMDDEGNGAVVWLEQHGSDARAFLAGYDGAGPRLTASFPASGTVGQTLPFSATALDVWSGATVGWSFGDGTGASGATAAHAYGSAGTFAASATAVDALGNASSLSATVPIVALLDTTRPAFRGRPSVRPRRVRRGGIATVRFDLDEAATVRAVLTARRPGVRVGRRCVSPRRRSGRGARRCKRVVAVAQRSTSMDAAGPGSIVLATKRLRPGRYAILLQATDAAGNRSGTVALRLTVVPRVRR